MVNQKKCFDSDHNEKRLVLVVEDEQVNREMLGLMLSAEYDVLYAENGEAALSVIREFSSSLSLILLDVLMPVMDGCTLLSIIKKDDDLKRIPVIVLTTEKEYEVKCLKLGASDFIKKPYDAPEIVLARVQRIIELAESTYIIQNTEFDRLTGLYNQEFFYRYAEQYDRLHPQAEMDAILLDVQHFHLINALYGHDFGNLLLTVIADEVRRCLSDIGGLVCRKEADMFLLYIPHGVDLPDLLKRIQSVVTRHTGNSTVKLRMGIYPLADRSLDIMLRFDRAKLAKDAASKGKHGTSVAYYDDSLHKQQLRSQQLIDELDHALESGQFEVYFQPKYDVRGDEPVLFSAEALIRWNHPEFGFISPGVFIPLFEESGLIFKTDSFVWQRTVEQIKTWREKYGIIFPVSVNVSRIDLFDPILAEHFTELTNKAGLPNSAILLEVTESAYTEDSRSIVDMLEKIRSRGFKIEMDDFGAGYSSLNMLATLPIDVLKLDMSFIKNITANKKNLYILELIMQIKDKLGVPVIAEGIETREQFDLLKGMNCDIIQGYYFSPPVPADKFEVLLKEKVKK
ncbi:MAG: EAL domain-containing protein [Clostridia bacterium]|nr:EAL domain-containing protein [Clostridia bacterium]